jgi:NAD(P)H-hydrate repair Nnr-like enzyme with NAD(P)H-hydrate dehydratase domain
MTYHQVLDKKTTTGVTSILGTAYTSESYLSGHHCEHLGVGLLQTVSRVSPFQAHWNRYAPHNKKT